MTGFVAVEGGWKGERGRVKRYLQQVPGGVQLQAKWCVGCGDLLPAVRLVDSFKITPEDFCSKACETLWELKQ